VELINLVGHEMRYFAGLENGHGLTALELAVMQNDFIMTKIIIEKNFFNKKALAAANMVHIQGRCTLFMWSILQGNAAIAQLLLNYGAEIEHRTLHAALELGSPPEVLGLLLSAQPSLLELHHANKKMLAPLYVAVSMDNAAAVAIILTHMSDPSEPVQNFGATSTMAALAGAGWGTAEVVGLLLRGANGERPQPCALRLAISRRSTEVVGLLLRANGERPWPPGLRGYLRAKMPMFALRAAAQGFLRRTLSCGEATTEFPGGTGKLTTELPGGTGKLPGGRRKGVGLAASRSATTSEPHGTGPHRDSCSSDAYADLLLYLKHKQDPPK